MTVEPRAAQSRTYTVSMMRLQPQELAADNRQRSQMLATPRQRPEQSPERSRVSTAVEFLDTAIPLPKNLRSFALYCAVLLIIAAGMMIHLLLSVQILQAEVELAGMQAEHTVIKRHNGELLWMIGRATNMQQVQERAKAAGYVPISERQFVQTISLAGRTDLSPSAGTALPLNSQAPDAASQPSGETLDASEAATAPVQPDAAEAAGGALSSGPSGYVVRLQEWRDVLLPARDAAGALSAVDAQTPQAASGSDVTGSSEAGPGDLWRSEWRTRWTERLVDTFAGIVSGSPDQ